MARKKNHDEGGGPNWLDTYADMVTLLLTFFVLLFSISSVDAQKWEILVRSFSGELDSDSQFVVTDEELSTDPDGVLQGQEQLLPDQLISNPEDVKQFDDLYKYLQNYIQENDLESDISLYNGDGFTFIIFRNNIFFDGNSSVLKSEGKMVLDAFTGAMINISDQIGKISCEGHTARAADEGTANQVIADRKLSSDRAVNVLCYIQQKNVLAPEKLVSTGHGEFKPIVPHDGTEATRQKNRRVELCIYESGKTEVSLDEIYKMIAENEETKEVN